MVRIFIRFDGDKYWYLDHQHHRSNGPAVIYASGIREWWWHGEPVGEFALMMLLGQEITNG